MTPHGVLRIIFAFVAINVLTLPVQRHILVVSKVSSCPKNETSWRSSAARLGCNLDIAVPESSTGFYYCIPIQSLSKLVEFCYDWISTGLQSGECIVLTNDGYLKPVDCKLFVEGCPNEVYLSETIYMYQACLEVNTEKQCYLAEKGCMSSSSAVKDLCIAQEDSTTLNSTSYTRNTVVKTVINVTGPSVWNFSGMFTTPALQISEYKSPSEEQIIFGSIIVIFMGVATIFLVIVGNQFMKRASLRTPILNPTFLHNGTFSKDLCGDCRHISFVSAESIWIGDFRGELRLVNKKSKVIDEIKDQRLTFRVGLPFVEFHTITWDGYLLYIDKNRKHVHRVNGREPILILQTDDYKLNCIFSTPGNEILIGGVDRYETGVILRCIISEDTSLRNIKTYKAERIQYQLPCYITENVNGDVIVSDWERSAVVILDNSGRHRLTYKGHPRDTAFSPIGVCTDTCGRILVCDDQERTVHILSKNGKFLSFLPTIKHDINRPCSLCVGNDHSLLVGDWENRKVHVFRYSLQT